VVGLYGNTFSKLDVAGDTLHVVGSRPANRALRGLRPSADALAALHASTMLKFTFAASARCSLGPWLALRC